MKCRARTAENVDKAYDKGRRQGIHEVGQYFLMLSMLFLADKCGWRETRLARFMKFFNQYSEELANGDITGEEIREILKNEYNVEVELR